MPKGVFSIFKKDSLLIYDLVIFITVVYLIILLLLNNFEFGFFHRDVMPKGVFSIFKKDSLLIYDLVIFITVVYLIILLLLNNFEFVLRKQSKLQTKLLRSYFFSSLTGHHF